MNDLCTATTNELIHEQIRNIVTKDNIEMFEITDDEIWLDSYDILVLIDQLFWHLPFKPTTKGTTYYKFAVYFAYLDDSLLFDNKKLVEKVAKYTNTDAKNVRALLDSILYTMNKTTSKECLSNYLQSDYEISNLTVKYFIAILVNKLNVLTGKERINMYNFI